MGVVADLKAAGSPVDNHLCYVYSYAKLTTHTGLKRAWSGEQIWNLRIRSSERSWSGFEEKHKAVSSLIRVQ
jgi:hypothetical protein